MDSHSRQQATTLRDHHPVKMKVSPRQGPDAPQIPQYRRRATCAAACCGCWSELCNTDGLAASMLASKHTPSCTQPIQSSSHHLCTKAQPTDIPSLQCRGRGLWQRGSTMLCAYSILARSSTHAHTKAAHSAALYVDGHTYATHNMYHGDVRPNIQSAPWTCDDVSSYSGQPMIVPFLPACDWVGSMQQASHTR